MFCPRMFQIVTLLTRGPGLILCRTRMILLEEAAWFFCDLILHLYLLFFLYTTPEKNPNANCILRLLGLSCQKQRIKNPSYSSDLITLSYSNDRPAEDRKCQTDCWKLSPTAGSFLTLSASGGPSDSSYTISVSRPATSSWSSSLLLSSWLSWRSSLYTCICIPVSLMTSL